LGVGSGCKEMHEYLKGTQDYIVTAELGTATDTYDREGVVTHQKLGVKLDREVIEAVIPEFVGEQVLQTPPV
jgi:tRNA pseudouridine55 synthase